MGVNGQQPMGAGWARFLAMEAHEAMERLERSEELAEAREDPRPFQEPSGGELSRSVTIPTERRCASGSCTSSRRTVELRSRLMGGN